MFLVENIQMKLPFHRLLLLLLLLLLLPGAALSQTDGHVLRATLKNGLRVVIVKNALAPVVTTQINYLAGSNETPPRASPVWPMPRST